MPREQKNEFKFVMRPLLTGLFLLGMVFLTPDAAQHAGQSLFAVARTSAWRHLGDWPAAWCSLKIILLGISGLLLAFSVEEFLIICRRKTLATLFLVSFIVPLPIFCAG